MHRPWLVVFFISTHHQGSNAVMVERITNQEKSDTSKL
jgi:hypothetical protein